MVFLLLLIPGSNQMKMRLTNMELTSLSRGGYSTRTNKTVYIFAFVYLGILILSFIAYIIAGMPVFDAACHAMSVSATGGFSSRNLSIAAFDSRWIEGITMVFMYLSSLHFGVIYLAIITRSNKPYDNPVVKFYTFWVLIMAVIVGAGLRGNGICTTWGNALWNGLFETLCVTTTSGFAILDNAEWPLWIVMVLMFSAIMCGSAGSTSGGEMQYSLDGATYSKDVPTGTDAGEYTVWYKVIGDANHNTKSAKHTRCCDSTYSNS